MGGGGGRSVCDAVPFNGVVRNGSVGTATGSEFVRYLLHQEFAAGRDGGDQAAGCGIFIPDTVERVDRRALRNVVSHFDIFACSKIHHVSRLSVRMPAYL